MNIIDFSELDLEELKNMELPSHDEMNEMTVDELEAWVQKLHPFYYCRKEILDTAGFELWQKTLYWTWLYMMTDNIKKGLPRWERVAT